MKPIDCTRKGAYRERGNSATSLALSRIGRREVLGGILALGVLSTLRCASDEGDARAVVTAGPGGIVASFRVVGDSIVWLEWPDISTGADFNPLIRKQDGSGVDENFIESDDSTGPFWDPIAANATNVFVGTPDCIVAGSITHGETRVVFNVEPSSLPPNPRQQLLDATDRFLLFRDFDSHDLLSFNLATADLVVLTQETDKRILEPAHLVVHGATASGEPGLVRFSLQDGTAELLAPWDDMEALAATDEHYYWLDSQAGLWRIVKKGGEAPELVTPAYPLSALTGGYGDRWLFAFEWGRKGRSAGCLSQDSPIPATDGHLRFYDTTTGGTIDLLTKEGLEARQWHIAGSTFYWTQGNTIQAVSIPV